MDKECIMSVRLRRSELSVPGSNPKMIEKAIASAADLVFLDLEDAVAPAQKESSRANVIAALKNPNWDASCAPCALMLPKPSGLMTM
jgi:citrate lyase beta subunit